MLGLLKSKEKLRKERIFLETKDYIVKNVETKREMYKAQKLRYSVFFLETKKRYNVFGVDKDFYDDFFDHIIVVHKQTNKVVATYRLTNSLVTNRFYSQNEFIIDDILKLDGIKVELGRAAVKKEHRNGMVFILLWKAILSYAKDIDARYLFGCSSVDVSDANSIFSIYEFVKNKPYYDDHSNVKVKENYSIFSHFKNYNIFKIFNKKIINQNIDNLIPSLLKFYIKSGAKIYGEPAFDSEFQCIDFFTLIDLNSVSKQRKKKFDVC